MHPWVPHFKTAPLLPRAPLAPAAAQARAGPPCKASDGLPLWPSCSGRGARLRLRRVLLPGTRRRALQLQRALQDLQRAQPHVAWLQKGLGSASAALHPLAAAPFLHPRRAPSLVTSEDLSSIHLQLSGPPSM